MAYYYFNHDTFNKGKNPGAAAANVKYNADLSKTQMDKFLNANADYLAEHGFHRPQWQIDAHLQQIRHGRTAAENAAYNAREEVTYAIVSNVIPADPEAAAQWFRDQEKIARKNARMGDRFIAALDNRLSPQQNIDVVHDFCKTTTGDLIPYHAGLHLELDKMGQPDRNAHTHILFFDRHIETGNRHLFTSAGSKEHKELDAKGIRYWTTTDLRRGWQDAVNRGLERAGIDDRVDCRSYKDRGIDKVPGVHRGPKADALTRKGIKPQSKEISERGIMYSLIDSGTRAEHNERLKKASPQPKKNIPPELAKLREEQNKELKAMYVEQKGDRHALRKAHNAEISAHRKWARQLYAAARKAAYDDLRKETAPKWEQIRRIPDREKRNDALATMKLNQKAIYEIMARKLVKLASKDKDKAYRAMMDRHVKERGELHKQHAEEYKLLTSQHLAQQQSLGKELRASTQFFEAGQRAEQRHHFIPPHQSMAAQQQAIMRANILRAHGERVNPYDTLAVARTLTRIADREGLKRKLLRKRLSSQRQTHSLLGMHTTRSRAPISTAPSADQKVRENMLTGQPLTDADKLNASPGLRAKFDAAAKRTKREAYFTHTGRQATKTRDRGGGGRER